MGQVFPLIADEALEPLDTDAYPRCQVCGRAAPVYVTFGRALSAKTNKRDKVYAACESCFKQGKLEQVRPTLPVAQAVGEYLQGHYKRKSAAWLAAKQKEMLDALDHTPCSLPPCRQEIDWPLCCGELTEYVGCPAGREELRELEDMRAWNFRLNERSVEEGISFAGCPDELLTDAAVFRCEKCSQHYLIFQPS
jgi:hypothetical protein